MGSFAFKKVRTKKLNSYRAKAKKKKEGVETMGNS